MFEGFKQNRKEAREKAQRDLDEAGEALREQAKSLQRTVDKARNMDSILAKDREALEKMLAEEKKDEDVQS